MGGRGRDALEHGNGLGGFPEANEQVAQAEASLDVIGIAGEQRDKTCARLRQLLVAPEEVAVVVAGREVVRGEFNGAFEGRECPRKIAGGAPHLA